MHILTLSAVAALASGAASLPRPTNVLELMRTFAGKHELTAYDWSVYMDFADRHGWRQAQPAGREGKANEGARA